MSEFPNNEAIFFEKYFKFYAESTIESTAGTAGRVTRSL